MLIKTKRLNKINTFELKSAIYSCINCKYVSLISKGARHVVKVYSYTLILKGKIPSPENIYNKYYANK